MKKILFITGSRADYGKMKSLMKCINGNPSYELFLFVTGMHMMPKHGNTWRFIKQDGFKEIFTFSNNIETTTMDLILSKTIAKISEFVSRIHPDMVIIHGDRLEALAGAIVGAFNNILVAHIEGGEQSGSIDESIRHAISKLAHIHFVSNDSAKNLLVKMGENINNIHIIGSPENDIMLSNDLPSLSEVRNKYNINYKEYGILIYHPVTTELSYMSEKIKNVVDGVIRTKCNYIVIVPNNDMGSEIIFNEYARLIDRKEFMIFPSIQFEYYATLLKYASFIIGNSSSGIKEAQLFGIPAIDIGSRQCGRYDINNQKNIIHIKENADIIEETTNLYKNRRFEPQYNFGNGNSNEKFINLLDSNDTWSMDIQKKFI